MKKISLGLLATIALSYGSLYGAAPSNTPKYPSFESAVEHYVNVHYQRLELEAQRLDSSRAALALHSPLRAAQRKYRVMSTQEREEAIKIMNEWGMKPALVMPKKTFFKRDREVRGYRE